MGEDLGDDWDEMVDKLEAGDDLGEGEEGGMPDLGAADDAGAGIGAPSSDDF